jgi:hypothetical protein
LLACVILTTDSMTGTFTRTPTTVASGAPDSKPNSPKSREPALAPAVQGALGQNAARRVAGAQKQHAIDLA